METTNQILPQQRIPFIDIAKGITIWSVVWYHIGSPFEYWLNLFFIPLFFFISGIFLNPTLQIKVFIKKKAKGLLGPLCMGSILGLSLEAFVYNFSTTKTTINSGFYNFWLVGNVPLWFLLSLFYIMIISYCIEHYITATWKKTILYLSLSLLGCILSTLHIKNTVFIGQALLGLPFFIIAYHYCPIKVDNSFFEIIEI